MTVPWSIAFLIRSLGVGGAERQLAALARGLAARGHPVTVYTYYGDGLVLAELRAAGVVVVVLDKRGRWDLLRPFRTLWRDLRRRRPKILHGYLPDANLLSLLTGRAVGSRVVWGVRASRFVPGEYDWLVNLLFWLTRVAARWSDLIIANSAAGLDWHVARGYPAERSVVIPNGIDLTVYRPDPARRKAQRATWGIAPEERLVGLVGRLDPMKDHTAFLRAAALAHAENPAVRFVCVGDGPADLLRRYQADAASLGLAHHLAWYPAQGDVSAVYNALDLLVSSSRFGEGFSNVLGEAMACGVRCVATEVGDARAVVGESGIVVPPGDPAALARGVGILLSAGDGLADPRARIAANYSVERLTERTEDVLTRLLEAPR